MAKKVVNSDIYNLSQLVDDVKSVFIPDETDETLAIGTYGYIGALEAHRLQTQVQMTGELCNEVFPSRARLNRNVITHAIMTNIDDINAAPAKMTTFLAIKEADIIDLFDKETNLFIIDRECPIYIGDYEFHLEYDIKLKRIYIDKKGSYAYTAQYVIPSDRDVPTSTIDATNQYLSPPAVIKVNNDSYIYLTAILAQVEHKIESKKLVTSNIIDNKTMNFEFENQLAYFEVHCSESDQDYYLTPVFEGSSVPEGKSKYYCWYQYIDTNLIRVRFDRHSYMPGLNATVECLIKTCQGAGGNFTYGEDTYIELESKKYGYKGVTCLLTPISSSAGGKDKKSKKELQSLIPKEALSRGSMTTITDLNNYFSMLDSEYGRIIIQKKIDNQIERVYYAYFVAKDQNNDVIPSNTVDVEVDINDFIKSTISETDAPRYLLPSGECFRLDEDGVARINKDPILGSGWKFKPYPIPRGQIIEDQFTVVVNDEVDIHDLNQVSVRVDLGPDPTKTHVWPAVDEKDKYHTKKRKIDNVVEDYMQMGVGNIYTYIAEYTTKEDNAIINAYDLNLDCFDLVDGFYIANGATKHFNKLPIVAYGLPANTKITFGIKRRLNLNAKGIITFTNGDNKFKLHQRTETYLSTILGSYGLKGEVTNATTENGDIIELTEYGTINGGKKAMLRRASMMKAPEPPFTKKVVNVADLPPVDERTKNEWYWAITKKYKESNEEIPSKFTVLNGASDQPFILNVCEEQDLPPVEERAENEWYYVVTDKNGMEPSTIIPFDAESADHKVHVVNEDELPPVGERGNENDWYLVVTKSEQIGPEPPTPGPDPKPPVPEELTGKDYKISFIKSFDEPVAITVTIDEKPFVITIDQDKFNVENGISVTENKILTYNNNYLTYVPVLEQNKWPSELNIGDQVTYTLKYKSCGNGYAPDITVKLSRGLDYVLFTNMVTYPGKKPISYEPVEVPLNDERGFLYTNPYAINVNGYRLYSAFYMMSVNENPYLQFKFINDKSNIQFISTNAHWSRAFYGDSNKYHLSVNLTQSVQDNIGLINESDPDATPLVKAVAVFYRDGAPYRYRSMDLKSFDPSTYSFTFEQVFESADILDHDNNIRVSNVQAIGQAEYGLTLTHDENRYFMINGGSALLSKVLNSLRIEKTGEIISVTSSNRYALDVYPVFNAKEEIIDYEIRSFNSMENPATITIDQEGAESIVIDVTSTWLDKDSEYGFFNDNTEVKIYTLVALPDSKGEFSRYDFDSICKLPGWTLTNTFDVVNGVTMYHNYSEIMGSRVTPYGTNYVDENNNVVMKLEGYKINSVPMLGYDYCQEEQLVQNAIDALNYRKAYIDNAVRVLENSFGIDFKLFNTYGPSHIFYIIRDVDKNGVLDNDIEYIDRVNLTLNFRIKLISSNDSYTKDNIIREIKDYIEDLDDMSQLHIPNLITQITNNYKEQVSYFEYLGFNDYGADIQHIYKMDDDDIPIHTAPEFLCINNVVSADGTTVPDINIHVSEI